MSFAIPTTQTAAIIQNPGSNAHVVIKHDIPVPEPHEGEVLVKMECCGLWCATVIERTSILQDVLLTTTYSHSDVRALLGWGPYNPIPGHEGIGTVVAIGPNTPKSILDKRVGIKWLYSACGSCSTCRDSWPNNCSKQLNTGKGDVAGTLRQFAIADAKYVTLVPDEVKSEVAAPLLCAGLSMAGAIGQLEPELKRGDWLVLPGAGGGLGHLGLQIAARVKGYKVITVDTGDARKQLCMDLGATAFIDFASEDVEAKVKDLTEGEGANGIIVVPGNEKAYELAPKLIRNRGVIVCVGLPKAGFNIPITPLEAANRGLVIKGSSTGNEEQMQELFKYAIDGTVLPLIEIRDFEQTSEVLHALRRDEVKGRIVVRIPH
jgi:propanol-preferring alcohol dehydrogenase